MRAGLRRRFWRGEEGGPRMSGTGKEVFDLERVYVELFSFCLFFFFLSPSG